MNHLGRVIRGYRKLNGLSQIDLAWQAAIHVNTLTRYELGKGIPAPGMLRKIEIALRIPPGQCRTEAELLRTIEETTHHLEKLIK